MKKIECVILDWAGTAVDYGCFAPVSAFIESFRTLGLEVSAAETRAHMGLTKIEEIRALFRIDHVNQAFREKYGRDYNENDIQSCYAEFQRLLFSTLRNYSGPIAHVRHPAWHGHPDRLHHRIYPRDDGHRHPFRRRARI